MLFVLLEGCNREFQLRVIIVSYFHESALSGPGVSCDSPEQPASQQATDCFGDEQYPGFGKSKPNAASFHGNSRITTLGRNFCFSLFHVMLCESLF